MKKFLAILLAVSMIFCLAACGGNDESTTTTAAETTEAVADDELKVEYDEPSTDAPVADASAESSEAATTPEGETVPATAAETTVPAIAEAPTEVADIVAIYNNAVNNAYNAKAGFSKERSADNEKLETSGALGALKDLVYKFMGIGAENKYTETVTKGNWDSDAKKHYLRKSTLTAADVTGATCTASGSNYTVVLNVKGGNSKGSESEKYTNAPIDKCGICVGNEDKGYFDHKTGEVIYDAIAGTYASAVIEESYDNAKVTAVIDGATGNLLKLTVEYDINCTMDVGIVGSGAASGTAHIIYSNFKY